MASKGIQFFLRDILPQLNYYSPEAAEAFKSALPKLSKLKDLDEIAKQSLNYIPKELRSNSVKQTIKNFTDTAKYVDEFEKAGGVGVAKGLATNGILAPIIAGAAATAAWAYPAKKLGEEIGWRIEEKKAGRRLRGQKIPYSEYERFLPQIRTGATPEDYERIKMIEDNMRKLNRRRVREKLLNEAGIK